LRCISDERAQLPSAHPARLRRGDGLRRGHRSWRTKSYPCDGIGRGGGVGRGFGVNAGLAVGKGLDVEVGVAVEVAVAVGVGVGVDAS
jgi:hypothetical protein